MSSQWAPILGLPGSSRQALCITTAKYRTVHGHHGHYLSDQHWIHSRFQCHCLCDDCRPLYFISHPDMSHDSEACQGRRDTFRTMAYGQLSRTRGQHHLSSLSHYLDLVFVLPTSCACHSCHHELVVCCLGRDCYPGACVVFCRREEVLQWTNCRKGTS